MAFSGTSKIRRKLALVIGINDYDNFSKLRCSENDANDMSAALKSINFEVTLKIGVNLQELEYALSDVKKAITNNHIVVVFFAGHGVQLKGENYLIMKDTEKSSPENLEGTALSTKMLLDQIGNKRPYANIFFFDCCQSDDLNFSDGKRGDGTKTKGLAPMERAGSLIAYACMPGTTATEPPDARNGIFTKYLLKEIVKPNAGIFSILTNVTKLVKNDPLSNQIPYQSGALTEHIILNDTISDNILEDDLLVSHEEINFEKEIGFGGFGIVYRAHLRDCEVAVKQLRLPRLDQKTETDFRRELKMLQKLKHPNIICLLGACIEPGHYALIMELMTLGSLYRLLHIEKNLLDWPTRLSIVFQAAKGVDYLHSLIPPVVHRDIKSSNVLLNGSSSEITVKICDFGLAKARDETTRQTDTVKGVLGSLPWTAPEILEMNNHTIQSDVYSLAIVYWEIASHKIPYDGKQNDIISAFVLRQARLPIPSETPPSLTRIIEKCWAHIPKDRLTCREIIKILGGELSHCFHCECSESSAAPLVR